MTRFPDRAKSRVLQSVMKTYCNWNHKVGPHRTVNAGIWLMLCKETRLEQFNSFL